LTHRCEWHVARRPVDDDERSVGREAIHLTLDLVPEAVVGDEGDERQRLVDRAGRRPGLPPPATAAPARTSAGLQRLLLGLGDRLLDLDLLGLILLLLVLDRFPAARPAHRRTQREDPS